VSDNDDKKIEAMMGRLTKLNLNVASIAVTAMAGWWGLTQTGQIEQRPIPTEPHVSVEALAVVRHNEETLATLSRRTEDLWRGEAPKEGRVPLWHLLLEAIEKNTAAQLEHTQVERESIYAMRSLAAELEDYSHQRPAPDRYSTATPERAEPPRSAWEQLVSWWQGT
jgi:hypothetical protein